MEDVYMQKASFEKRLGALLIDHVIIVALLAVGFLFYSWDDLLNAPQNLLSFLPSFLLIAFLCYCLKDVFRGTSVGKWTMGLVVKNSEEPETPPTTARLFFRNIFTFVWPLELLVYLCGKNKRKLGDIFAGTDVYSTSRKVKTTMIVVAGVLMTVLFVPSLVFGVTVIIKNDASYKVAIAYIETNEEVRSIVGEIAGYGFFVSGNLSYTNGFGTADYIIKVIGDRQSLNVRIILERTPGDNWRIVYTSLNPSSIIRTADI
jgi:uncharacterized RDD family membrane protein YckC